MLIDKPNRTRWDFVSMIHSTEKLNTVQSVRPTSKRFFRTALPARQLSVHLADLLLKRQLQLKHRFQWQPFN